MTVGLEPAGPAKLSRAQISTFATSPQAVANYEAIQDAAFVTNPQLAAAASAAAADASADAAAANANAASRQPSSANLTGISSLDATPGLVEQVAPNSFTKRAIGAVNPTDIPALAQSDVRYVMKTTTVTWTAPTGTALRSGFSTYTAIALSAVYDNTQLQPVADKVQQLSQTLKALIDDLIAKGVLP